MRVIAHLCLVGLCLLVASCGCGKKGARHTGNLTVEELKTKLESLKKPYEGECPTCLGEKTVIDQETGMEKPCPTCGGKGIYKRERGPGLDEFYKIIGEPAKTEDKDLIWEWWYYYCEEGPVRVEAFINEEQGDIARVVTRNVELIKDQ
ncbi:MAG: hypothetical protein ACODAJ_15510 [Planctomycetota bacterium]